MSQNKTLAAQQKDAVFHASIDFIAKLTGLKAPPIEVAPPEVFAPFREFSERVCAIFERTVVDLTAERDTLAVELEAIKAHATQNSVENWLALPAELRAMSMGVMLKRVSEQCRRIAELERSHAAKDAEIVELKALRQSFAKLVDSLNARLAVSRAPATDQQIGRVVNPFDLFDSYRDTCIWRAAEKHHGIT